MWKIYQSTVLKLMLPRASVAGLVCRKIVLIRYKVKYGNSDIHQYHICLIKLYSYQSAVGYEYEGKTEKHASQKGN